LPRSHVNAEVPQDGSLAYKITRICLVPFIRRFGKLGDRSTKIRRDDFLSANRGDKKPFRVWVVIQVLG